MGRPKKYNICQICEISFYHPKRDVKCCSIECREILKEQLRLVEYDKECKICEKTFTAKSIHAKYCSAKCLDKGKHVEKKCVICTNLYTGRKDSRACSKECKTLLIQQRKETLQCFRCLKEFTRPASQNGIAKKAGRAFCSHSCANKTHVYELYGKLNKYSGNWGKARDEVFEIYGKACIKCSAEEDIAVHHTIPKKYFILFPKLSDNIEYLIPLCQECHKGVHRNHDEWFEATYSNIESKIIVKDIV